MTIPARARLAAAQRRLIEAAATKEISDEELTGAAAALDELAAQLEGNPARDPKLAELPDLNNLHTFFHDDPISGRDNPIAPPVEITFGDGAVEAHVTFSRSYEGAPGFVHGGAIAAAFDQVLGMANLVSGHPGMTGTLTIRYVSPTPTETDLRFEAEAGEKDGRKSFVTGRCYAGDTLTAEAEATFVMLRFKKAAEMFLGRTGG
ncbi:MAG TPA: PaaI family thioesterase [Actinomycetota bacterium]|nr:PaaI family thioesterase [Actinomycetota bacterium]